MKETLLKVGDKVIIDLPVGMVTIKDFTMTITEIIYQEPYEWRDAYYIEFRDQNGCYRSWKQNIDGGKAVII